MKLRSRAVAVFAGVMLLAAGCVSRTNDQTPLATGGKYGSGVDVGLEDPAQPPQASAPAPPAAGGGGQPAVPRQPPEGGVGSAPLDGSAMPRDDGSAGMNAFFYLSDRVPNLVVEIDAVEGRAPEKETLDLLRRRLASVIARPGNMRFLAVENIPQPSKTTWSRGDIQDLEGQHRNTFSSRDTAVIYLLFVNGSPDRRGPIGVAYSGSSAVIFIDQIRGVATPLVPASAIERSTVIHEVGHLLALVNLTYESPRDHEDPDHEGHSKNPGSVMYWAVENIGVVNLLGGRTAPPTDFDADDRADLADLRSGKLP